eukprot:c17214_g1_i2 orf=718-2208(-)
MDSQTECSTSASQHQRLGDSREGVSELITTPPGDIPMLSTFATPQPMEGLQSHAPPPFLTKTFDMVNDPDTDSIVSWSSGSNSFIVWDLAQFSQHLLPRYFKHSNFSSFIRQLNTYGFRKVDPDRWEFANEGFLRGQKHLLKYIHRRKPSSHVQGQQQAQTSSTGACVEVGKFGLEEEIERLKRDKNVLMVELVRLRQEQHATEKVLQAMAQRLQATEQRQQQMLTFLARAIQNPTFLARLVQQNENKQLGAERKKRRLPKHEEDCEEEETEATQVGQIVEYHAESLRASILQILEAGSSLKDLPSIPLDALLYDMESSPQEHTQQSTFQGGVTINEGQSALHMAHELPDPIVHDITDQAEIHLPTVALEKLGSPLSAHDPRPGRHVICEALTPGEGKACLMPFELALSSELDAFSGKDNKQAGSRSEATVPSMPEIMWEQLLTEPLDTEAELPSNSPGAGLQEPGDLSAVYWWSSHLSVDQLAEQMGHLDHESKS